MRPLLVSIPADNLAARIVEQSGGGIVIRPGETPAFLAAAETLLDDEALRTELAARARAYAETAFDLDSVAGRFEEVLERLRASKS
jgi:glycosyltransferase involved in cell wall biosynthesis